MALFKNENIQGYILAYPRDHCLYSIGSWVGVWYSGLLHLFTPVSLQRMFISRL